MQFNYSTQRGPDPPAPPHTGIGSIQFDFIPNVLVDTDPATPTRESDLVLPRFSNRCIFELLFDGTVNIIPDVPDPFTVSGETGSSSYNDGSGEFLIAGELYFDCSSQVWDSGNIMPLFALRIDTIEADGMYLATDETTTGDTGGATVKVDSSQSPLVSTDLLANADLGGVTTVITFKDDITIDPIEFWPYKTKAGLPVYDTSDGSILNAPD